MRQYAAPAAALLAVTAAVLAVHYTIQKKPAAKSPAVLTVTLHRAPHHHPKAASLSRFYVVQRGDSFSTIAVKTRTSVARLERLNPNVSPTALRVGERIRVK